MWRFLAAASEVFAAAELESSSPKDGIAALRRAGDMSRHWSVVGTLDGLKT